MIYLAQLERAKLAQKRELLRQKLDILKKMPHDKQTFKQQKKEIMEEMGDLVING